MNFSKKSEMGYKKLEKLAIEIEKGVANNFSDDRFRDWYGDISGCISIELAYCGCSDDCECDKITNVQVFFNQDEVMEFEMEEGQKIEDFYDEMLEAVCDWIIDNEMVLPFYEDCGKREF